MSDRSVGLPKGSTLVSIVTRVPCTYAGELDGRGDAVPPNLNRRPPARRRGVGNPSPPRRRSPGDTSPWVRWLLAVALDHRQARRTSKVRPASASDEIGIDLGRTEASIGRLAEVGRDHLGGTLEELGPALCEQKGSARHRLRVVHVPHGRRPVVGGSSSASSSESSSDTAARSTVEALRWMTPLLSTGFSGGPLVTCIVVAARRERRSGLMRKIDRRSTPGACSR